MGEDKERGGDNGEEKEGEENDLSLMTSSVWTAGYTLFFLLYGLLFELFAVGLTPPSFFVGPKELHEFLEDIPLLMLLFSRLAKGIEGTGIPFCKRMYCCFFLSFSSLFSIDYITQLSSRVIGCFFSVRNGCVIKV